MILRPERWAAGGETIARDGDGRVVFVRGALPGETVAVSVVADKRDWARAVAVDVVDPSPDRLVPPCPSRRDGCGGCGWQHVSIAAQQRARVETVGDALRRTGGLVDAVVVPGGAVPPVGYRTTVRVVPTAEGRAGYRAEGSHRVVAAPECLVAHAAIRTVLPGLEMDPGVEATLRVSVATGALAARWDPAAGRVRGVPAAVAVGPDAALEEVVAGRSLRVSMGSFFQSGPAAAELLVDAVRRAGPELDGAGLVVDAYAGIGLFAACAADSARRLIAVETSRRAVADARHNLADRDADVVRGELGRWRPPRDRRIEVVIADPARTGLGRPGVEAIMRTKTPVLVLVSCDPASLARDARLLGAAGYLHECSEVIDTFPHTSHIEAVTRFSRA